jgi:DNA mismatch repair protein MLH1
VRFEVLMAVSMKMAVFKSVSVSDQYTPETRGLPLFLVYLSTEIDWDDEKGCFDSFCRETARFYSKQLQSDYWEDGHEDSLSQVDMP